ncbi:hypothetical protein OSB04_028791 [Centaurea solstitialis]|uniref:Uncharacterized protein n=1 Tax=Centaurea solstitialis TaxID=347529 RepID=A0AA38W829_9ASTR|nr:hypothetical protein OSB04_028791 [Centaurea solstitialis]
MSYLQQVAFLVTLIQWLPLLKSSRTLRKPTLNGTSSTNPFPLLKTLLLRLYHSPPLKNPFWYEESLHSNHVEEGSNLDLISSQYEDAEEEDDDSQHNDNNLSAYLSLSWQSNNFLAIIDLPPGKEHLTAARDFLLRCPLKTAFTDQLSTQ